jgi:hypothetical protein
MRQSVLIRRDSRGPDSQRASCGARWRPRAAPQGSRPRCHPRGRGWGGVSHACTRGGPQTGRGSPRVLDATGPARTEEAARPFRTGKPAGAVPGDVAGGGPAKRGDGFRPSPCRTLPLHLSAARGPIGPVACRHASAVILRRQRAPPGRFTLGEGFCFHKAATPMTQPCRQMSRHESPIPWSLRHPLPCNRRPCSLGGGAGGRSRAGRTARKKLPIL